MGPDNIKIADVVITTKDGQEFFLGDGFTDGFTTEASSEFGEVVRCVRSNGEAEFTINLKIPLKTRLRLKWETFKAKRRIRKLIKLLGGDKYPTEFTMKFKKGATK